ncbi:MAG: alpha/beta fold hydrolase [Geminocystis sp.]|nr:alpha/beta fold hydrolase [Geminocystis sp.]HIK36434.1 alpha/beta fold hydrolase [Geminocystis sp. M7585_C2015_104]MCS7147301.1 alpha/beta fold hydrolase [Geminocystis sp.]MCX8078815.1 alpha/beta fold hydrolase [Geminocystis sp.]MDW8116300.1 alpha/beta fold hydrolase [Geminocystis sp.]
MSKIIVMVHGISDTGDVFQSLASHLQKQGYQTYAPDLTPSYGLEDLTKLAIKLKHYIDTTIPRGSINLLGFSMGGLVTRYYLQRLNGIERVKKYITISAPNNGTITAYFLPFAGVVQMRPNSNFLNDLNQDRHYQLGSLEILNLWTPFDMTIIPAKSSLMGLGLEKSIPVWTHRWMLEDKRVFAQITQFLAAPNT